MIEARGPGVTVLARLEDESIVAVREGNRLATAFHPELTTDTRLHRYFVRAGGERRHPEARRGMIARGTRPTDLLALVSFDGRGVPQ